MIGVGAGLKPAPTSSKCASRPFSLFGGAPWPLIREGEQAMRVGVAADHGGFELKEQLRQELKALGHEVVDYGAHEYAAQDDYPDLVLPLARAVARGEVERG